MKSAFNLLLFLIFCATLKAQNKTYYITSSGNDGNSGLSYSAAWKTIDKVSSFDFKPGDRILFQGGQQFRGSLSFGQSDVGTSSNPIYVGSFGSGKAIISSNASNGATVYNTGGIEIHDLVFFGNGAATNNSNGVEFFIDQTPTDIEHIIVDNIEVYGYGGRGIIVGAWGTPKGFNHVRITNSSAHDNGRTGIETFGFWPTFSHRDIYVGYCKAYRNLGRTDITHTNTGSGIALSGVDGALVEYCEAYENGQNNRSTGGGPVGIWFYDVRNGVIQYCESHHNKAGLLKDGGGFDLDGGCQNCTIQYCYSHENEGAGYGLFEYGSSNTYTNNTIRYNISQNDGRKNSAGGIYFWGEDATHRITNSEVYNNTVYVDNTDLVNGTPAAVVFLYSNMSNIKLWNNIFYAGPGAELINSTHALSPSSVLFQNNAYYATGIPVFTWGRSSYKSFADWKNAATGQEQFGNFSLGTTTDPLLVNPGKGGTIGPASGGKLQQLTAYQLQGASPMINAGLDLKTSFSINPGSKDYYSNSLLIGSTSDIGANEFPIYILPVYIKTFNGFYEGNQLVLNWSYSGNAVVDSAFVEISTDGKHFTILGLWSTTLEAEKVLTEKISRSAKGNIYCRIRLQLNDGKTVYSKTIFVGANKDHSLRIYPNPACNQLVVESTVQLVNGNITIKDFSGATISIQKTRCSDKKAIIDLSKFKRGVYTGCLFTKAGSEQTFLFVKQ